jgi:NAD(P) transhydrogenase
VTYNKEVMWPAPQATTAPAPVAALKKPTPKVEEPKVEKTPWQKAVSTVGITTGAMSTTLALGKLTGPAFMANFNTFGLAGLVGFNAVWNVTPALHSPLMCA